MRSLLLVALMLLLLSPVQAQDRPVISNAAVAMLRKIDTVGLEFGTVSEIALWHIYPQWGDGVPANITDWRFLYYELDVRAFVGVALVNVDGLCGVWLCLQYDRAQPGFIWYRVTITDAARAELGR